MYRYKAKIRIGGSVLNEVIREGMSAAEVMILRHLHGADAVVDIKESEKSDKTPSDIERERLRQRYVGSSERRSKPDFVKMFGPEHMGLPERLPEFEKRTEDAESIPMAAKGRKALGAEQLAG